MVTLFRGVSEWASEARARVSATLEQLSLDLSRNRQAAASQTTPDSVVLPPVVSLSSVLQLGGGGVNAALLLQSPPGFPAFPRVVALPPPTFLTLEPSQLQPHDPPLSRWFLSFSLCICSCYSGALCALCFHQRPDENQSPTSCPGPQASAPPRALAIGHS